MGENGEAARASGIRVSRTVIKGYVLDGFFTAVGGIVYMARMNSGLPDSGTSSEFDVITAVVIGGTSLTGGTGNVTGTLIGAVIVGIINNILNLWSINYNWQSIIKGIIILIAIIADYSFKEKNP
ncbi:MAG: ABC transporter permease [Ruminococcus sp.]